MSLMNIVRIAKIVACEAVEGSKKLLRLTLDAGEKNADGTPKLRNVFPEFADDGRFWCHPMDQRAGSGSLQGAPTREEINARYGVRVPAE